MIFSLFGPKKPLTPLEAGELIAVRFPIEPEVASESLNPMTGETIGSLPSSTRKDEKFRTLYGSVSKVSKKRNIFVQFSSKDKGENLQVGAEGILAVLKPKKYIEFPTSLLHQDEETFIFSPPMAFESLTVPSNKKGIVFSASFPIEYRATSSPYSQRGTLTEFSWDQLGFLANLPVPIGTTLKFEFVIPYRTAPVEMKGKVISCEPLPDHVRKHLVRLALDTLSHKDRDDMFHYFLLSKQPWTKSK